MCELFGFCAKSKSDIAPALRSFFSHGASNPNGWGLALDAEDNVKLVLEAADSSKSPTPARLLAKPVLQKFALAHLRRATVGAMTLPNCHPVYREDASGRGWMLMHNGTVVSGLSTDRYAGRAAGSTDSECILLELIDRLNRAPAAGGALSPPERFRIVEELILELAPRNKLNLLLSDGELLYVHMNMRDTLYSRPLGDGRLFATVPLDGSAWEVVPLSTVLAYRDGQLLYRGRRHPHEYVNTITTAAGPLDYVL